jgi:polar amino acid transport system substrate-binding protein
MKIWNKLLLILLTVLGIATTTQEVTAAEVIDGETNPDGKETLVIGLDDTFAPMGFRDEQNQLVGFDIDLSAEVAERLDYHFVYQPIDWSVKEQELNNGNIDMIWNGYGVTPEREELTLMSDVYLEDQQIIVTRSEDEPIESLEDLAGKTITTQSSSTSLQIIEDLWPDEVYDSLEDIVLYPNYNNAFIDLEAGRVDAVVVGGVYGNYVVNIRGEENYNIFEDPSAVEPIAVGMRKTDTELAEEINTTLAELKEDGTYDDIYRKWFGSLTAVASETDSQPEGEIPGQEFVIGLDDTFAPMGFRNEAGELVGFDIDLSQAAADLLGYTFTYQPIDWSVKEQELNSGNIDMIWNGYGVTPEREELVLMSDVYIEDTQIVVTRAEDEPIESLEDLIGKTVTTQSSSTALQIMEAEWPQEVLDGIEDLVLYPNYNNSFQDLDAGRVDAVVVGGVYGNYVVNLRGEENYNVFIDESAVEPMAVGMRKSDTELAEDINWALAELKQNGTYDEIYSKWFGSAGLQTQESSIFESMLPGLLDGLKLTLGLFAIVLVVSIPLGLLLAIPRAFGPSWLKALIEVYVFVMRSTPLLLQLMVVFFGLPYLGISFDRFPAAVFAFIINYTAYYIEIFRGGFTSISPGQYESLKVLGIGKVRGFIRIIVPQVMNMVLPSVGNEVVALVKDTSLVYVIGLGEILRVASISANTYASLVPYLIVGVIYMVLVGIITLLLRQIEKKLAY